MNKHPHGLHGMSVPQLFTEDNECRWCLDLAKRDEWEALAEDLGEALKFTGEQIPIGHYHGVMGQCAACRNEEALRRLKEKQA